jgi:DNA-directed RNA polymerases I, II, and III subunit RPABC2
VFDKNISYMNMTTARYETTAFLTKYEKARVLGLRALQIQQLDSSSSSNSIESAKRELEENKLSLTVRRYVSRDEFEDVQVHLLRHGEFDRRGQKFFLQEPLPTQEQEQVHKKVDKSSGTVPRDAKFSKFLSAGAHSSENV